MRLLFLAALLSACTSTKEPGETGETGEPTDTDSASDTDSATDTDSASDTDSATDTDTDTDTTAPDGAALFAGTCAACHGADGHGGTGPDLSTELGLTDDQLIAIIRNGKDEMPPQPLDDVEAKAVVDWMRVNL